MSTQFADTIQQKLADGLAIIPPSLTHRDIYLPAVPGKALAVIGMRRAGKTYFLWQRLAEKLASGDPRSALLYIDFEDERLADMRLISMRACQTVRLGSCRSAPARPLPTHSSVRYAHWPKLQISTRMLRRSC